MALYCTIGDDGLGTAFMHLSFFFFWGGDEPLLSPSTVAVAKLNTVHGSQSEKAKKWPIEMNGTSFCTLRNYIRFEGSTTGYYCTHNLRSNFAFQKVAQ